MDMKTPTTNAVPYVVELRLADGLRVDELLALDASEVRARLDRLMEVGSC